MSIGSNRHYGLALSPDLAGYVFRKRNNYAMKSLICSMTSLTPSENTNLTLFFELLAQFLAASICHSSLWNL